MLEPHEGKLSRAVLRGGGGSNTPDLPDCCGCGRIGYAAVCEIARCGFESRQSPENEVLRQHAAFGAQRSGSSPTFSIVITKLI